jgi:hypothetical protein
MRSFGRRDGPHSLCRKASCPSPVFWATSRIKPGANDFDQLAFKGNPLIEEVLFLHKPSRTVILDDLIQIHPRVKGRLFRNALFKLEGVEAPQGGVGLDIRLTFIHRTLARRSLEKLLSWDFDKLIIAHGPCIERNAKPFVERAFRWLDRPRRSNRASE